MDMSAFPRMLQFKQKTLPNTQLLRWAKYFSRYSFDVKLIKGTTNIIPNMLSIPPKSPQFSLIPTIYIMDSSSSSSSSTKSFQNPVNKQHARTMLLNTNPFASKSMVIDFLDVLLFIQNILSSVS